MPGMIISSKSFRKRSNDSLAEGGISGREALTAPGVTPDFTGYCSTVS